MTKSIIFLSNFLLLDILSLSGKCVNFKETFLVCTKLIIHEYATKTKTANVAITTISIYFL